ncbi:unnamed protein product [Prunus armeniaca]|uniref:Uncharacterized protein n=1 Tax=Prunus armeniaca TaxID=36596 RepID=A0A6J5VA32_PRUAR|nr:unnamed protein product [Prunus armeniaca]
MYGGVSMRVTRLAYVRRRVDVYDPFGLHPEMCRCVTCLAYVRRRVDNSGPFGLRLETCR